MYKDQITSCFEENLPLNDIVRKFFIVHPTYAFGSDLNVADEILHKVSVEFDIPINDILVCGSAKIGFSLKSNMPYRPGQSDLDLAIINNSLYCKIFNKVLSDTRNYSRKDLFSGDGLSRYKYGISLGMINYNFMPNSALKKDFVSFFDRISMSYRTLFSGISCCFYMSEDCFKQKQINGLNKWKIDNFKGSL